MRRNIKKTDNAHTVSNADNEHNGSVSDIHKSPASQTAAGLLGYAGCIGITVAVAYFIDGTAGIILTAALIIAFVISLVMTLCVMRSINAAALSDKTVLSKKETAVIKVYLSKKIILPAPIIEIRPDVSPHLELSDAQIYKGSVAGLETTVLEIPVTAAHFGEASVIIRDVRISDFLGIFSFRLKSVKPDEIKLMIYPDIPDAAVQTDFLKTAAMLGGSDDDEEETDETAAFGTGMPGYEHRQYVPGDPIKKINWKLSSKRDIYMIRLDEKTAAAGQLFFLDASSAGVSGSDLAVMLDVRDNVVEGLLAIFSMMIREGREAVFYHFSGGLWLKSEIRNMGDVYALQERFSGLKNEVPSSPAPPEALSADKTPICFTAAFKGQENALPQIVQSFPDILTICSGKAQLSPVCRNFWTISGDFEFRRIN